MLHGIISKNGKMTRLQSIKQAVEKGYWVKNKMERYEGNTAAILEAESLIGHLGDRTCSLEPERFQCLL
jgi:hypothetical protein